MNAERDKALSSLVWWEDPQQCAHDLNLVEVDPFAFFQAGWELSCCGKLICGVASGMSLLHPVPGGVLHVPVTMVSTGPERESLILKESSVQPA